MVYFFDTRDGDYFDTDEIGTELPSLEAAQNIAARTLVDLAREKTHGLVSRKLALEVRNASGAPQFTVSLSFEMTEPPPR